MLFVLSAPQKELGLQSFSLGICRLPGEDAHSNYCHHLGHSSECKLDRMGARASELPVF